MVNPLKAILAGVFALCCVYLTVGMLWAELGMPSNMGQPNGEEFPHTIKLIQAEGIFTPLIDHYNQGFKEKSEKHLKEANADGPMGDYVYSIAIALAFLAGGIAIIAAGSDDEVEKTVVPDKK